MVVRRLESLGLIIGPLLFALSPLFWIDGHYGVTGGLLIAIAAVPWVYGLIGEYNALRPVSPSVGAMDASGADRHVRHRRVRAARRV